MPSNIIIDISITHKSSGDKIKIKDTYLQGGYKNDPEAIYRGQKNCIDTTNKIINKICTDITSNTTNKNCTDVTNNTTNDSHKNIALLIAEPQSGKTCVIGRTIEIFIHKADVLEKYNINVIPRNIYVIIFMSSSSAKKQMQEKLENIFGFQKENVLHINELKKLLVIMDKNKEYLFIFDEIHMDLVTNSIVDNFLTEIKKYKTSSLFISATPFEHIKFTNVPKIIMKPNDGYISIKNLFDKGLIKQAKSLKDDPSLVKEYLNEIYNDIITIVKGYVIIRLPQIIDNKKNRTKIMSYVKNWCAKKEISYDMWLYDQEEKDSINLTLNDEPNCVKFILIKNKLRASESINKKYIISMHDSNNNMFVHTTAQSLVGRAAGYNANLKCTIYCDLENVKEYIKVAESNYNILPKKQRSGMFFKSNKFIK